jgi:electron transfer flavoprotein alpha subunit
MSTLVVAMMRSDCLPPTALSCATAASQLSHPVHMLLLGHGVGRVAQAASCVEGVSRVLVGDDASLQHGLAEPTAAMIASVVAA